MIIVAELVAIGANVAEFFDGHHVVAHANLSPATNYEIDGVSFTTLPDPGEILARVVTMNDVHFGETECGKIDGVTEAAFVVGPGEDPYPEIMNRSVIADALAINPDAVIVKGDLTSEGTLEEYDTFRRFYEPAFGDRLTYVRGNHDSYPGLTFADWPIQIVDLPGVRIVLLDTSRAHQTGGFVDDEQRAAVREACASSTTAVIVMGHHPIYVPDRDRPDRFDGIEWSQSAALANDLANAGNVLAYTAGHTHRCRRDTLRGVEIVQVACVKDFPGAWAEYVIGDNAILQIVHRASAADAIAWAEKTRKMFDGRYGAFAMGQIDDRCFALPIDL